MKLTNIHGFSSIDAFVHYKLNAYSKKEKTFESLFEMMFDETENIMVETTDGYRINKVTYGQFKEKILATVPKVAEAFSHVPAGKIVGIYMANCPEWLQLFWSILAAGYCPLLMNTRLPNETLDEILERYDVGGVISDGKSFCRKTLLVEEILNAPAGEYQPRPFGTEVFFMSSGTTNHVKLCAYNGENLYHQVWDSAHIVANCPDIKRHYEGELKQLMLLPLYHVFGFIAVYLWFGFFARTFVFPKDLNPTTIQRTVKKHKVTHIFAVPMVWEAVAKAANRKIKAQGDKTYRSFARVNKLVNQTGWDWLAKRLLSQVRDGLFGDSIMFLISGGSEISQSTLEFFNGIGYHMANGYGMTEIGITSVEKGSNKKILNSGSVGAPFGNTQYAIEDGCLMVKGKTRAARILCDGEETVTDYDTWFATGDMMACRKGRYYTQGRTDDLIITENGENLNPQLAEAAVKVAGIDQLCVFATADKKVALVASVPGCFAKNRLSELHESLSQAVAAAKLDKVIGKIYFTNDSLLGVGEFKLSRKKIAMRIKDGALSVFDPTDLDSRSQVLLEGLEKELQLCFAEVLGKEPEQIGRNSHFFRDLEGTSMDYYSLLSNLKAKFGVQIQVDESAPLATVGEFAAYLQNK